MEGMRIIVEHKARGGHFDEHYDWPHLSWERHFFGPKDGFPVLSEGTLWGEEGVCNWGSALHPIFPESGPKRRTQDAIEFKALTDYIRARPSYRKRFQPDDFFEAEVVSMLAGMLDRYICLTRSNHIDESELLRTYLPVEAFLLRDKLEHCLLVPILGIRFEEDSFLLGDLRVKRMDDGLHLARFAIRDRGTDDDVVSKATHAIHLGRCSVDHEGWQSRWTTTPYGQEVFDDLHRVFAAIRIVAERATGYSQLLEIPDGWAFDYRGDLPVVRGMSVREYPPRFRVTDSTPIERKDVTRISNLLSNMESCEGKSLLLAARRFNRCFMRESPEDVVLDATIGLEILLTKDQSPEIAHRASVRMAALSCLSEQSLGEPWEVYKDTKIIYDCRSSVVHGDPDALPKATKKLKSKHGEAFSETVSDFARRQLGLAIDVLARHPKFLDPSGIDAELIEAFRDRSRAMTQAATAPNLKG
jgi:hypothetical protein